MSRTVSLCVLIAFPAQANTNLADATTSSPVAMPASDRLWSSEDYAAALRVLRRMDPDQLPRLSSPVLQRMVDPDNLRPYQDRTIPLGVRLGTGVHLVQTTADVLKLYLAALLKDSSRSDEVIWLEGLMIEEASVMVGLANEVVPTIDAKSPDYADRMAGMDRVKQGLAQLMVNSIAALESKSRASNSSRQHLAAVLRDEWPKFAHFMPPQSRDGVKAMLSRIVRDDPDPEIRSTLAGLAVQ